MKRYCQTDMDNSIDKYFCYVYRQSKDGKIVYVGYATDSSRAYTDGHNERVRSFVESGEKYEISISGPYRDEQEARNVEAALVSGINPEFNLIDQPGMRFRPLGIPKELATRSTEEKLDAHEIGRITRGCIIVYCNLTSELMSGESKVGPTSFSDETIFNNIKGHWGVKKFLNTWGNDPSKSPTTLVAVQGHVKDRIVIGSARIDTNGWASAPPAPWDPRFYEIPLLINKGLDACELRGRKVDIKFGAGTANSTMVIDHTGLALHGYRIKGMRSSSEQLD
jgi:hypothetical protein